ncbi:hypothetical protein C8R47DRAFT_435588 [Mycena vitilis]|nr:hypothetical protein C8R47DRAFT_435588 [Mycena vitilis]
MTTPALSLSSTPALHEQYADADADADVPMPAATAAASKPRAKAAKQDPQRTALMTEYYNNVTQRPSSVAYDDLLKTIHDLPGEWNATYKLSSLKSWFTQRRSRLGKLAAAAPHVPLDPRWPTLTRDNVVGLECLYNTPSHTTVTYQDWIESASFENAEQRDTRKWIAKRAQDDPKNTSEAIKDWIDETWQLYPPQAAPPSLHIDTQQRRTSYAANRLPTPSYTTSPEPPPFSALSSASASSSGPMRSASTIIRFQPYPNSNPNSYRPPTPQSRAPSLALKSEPARSPLSIVTTLPAPAFSPSFASTSASASAPVYPSSAASSSSTPIPYLTPSPSVSLPPSATLQTHPLPPLSPPPPPSPPAEPPFGLRMLRAIKAELDSGVDHPSLAEVPTNWPEFQALYGDWEPSINLVLHTLRNLKWEPPTPKG